jgi:hypothetical protein
MRQIGVVGAAVVAHACDQATRLFGAQAFEKFLAEHSQRRVVQQHHALVVEPDATFAGIEVQARNQLVGGVQRLSDRVGRRCVGEGIYHGAGIAHGEASWLQWRAGFTGPTPP